LPRSAAAWAVLVAYSALIFFASSGATGPELPSVPGVDKVLHCGAYFVWATLCLIALGVTGWPRSRDLRAIAAILLTIAYGASDEIHQSFVPGRSADGWDLVADASGAVLAVLLEPLGQRLWARWRSPGGAPPETGKKAANSSSVERV